MKDINAQAMIKKQAFKTVVIDKIQIHGCEDVNGRCYIAYVNNGLLNQTPFLKDKSTTITALNEIEKEANQ